MSHYTRHQTDNEKTQIIKILQDPDVANSKNAFQPTRRANELLKNSDVKMNDKPAREWLNFVSDIDEVTSLSIGQSLYDPLATGAKQRKDDMQYRAKEAIDVLINNPEIYHKFAYFDGHGRLTLAILSYLNEIDRLDILDKVEFFCVEVEDAVHEWHTLFFPKDITCIQENLYNIAIEKQTFVYGNYCGIGGFSGLLKFMNFVERAEFQADMMMFSLSTRGFKDDPLSTLKAKLLSFDVTNITFQDKKKFITLKLTRRAAANDVINMSAILACKSKKEVAIFINKYALKCPSRRSIADSQKEVIAALKSQGYQVI